jgi:uncharacterized protein
MELPNENEVVEQTCHVMRTVLSAMLDRPETLNVVPLRSASGVVLRVSCDPAEMCKLIGKQGRTARALRILLMAVSKQNTCHLDIVENGSTAQVRHDVRKEADDSALCFA